MQEIIEEIKDMLEDAINPITKAIEVEIEEDDEEDDMEDTEGCDCEGCKECKANGGCTQKMCSGHKKVEKSENLTDEEISKSYESDNEDEDKWNNMEKACWSGYKQVGMKDKNGKRVPNCVPVEKSYDEEDKEEVKKSIWNGSFLK